MMENKQGVPERTPADAQLKTRIAPMGRWSGRKAEHGIDAFVASSPLPGQFPAEPHREPDLEKTPERTMRQRLLDRRPCPG